MDRLGSTFFAVTAFAALGAAPQPQARTRDATVHLAAGKGAGEIAPFLRRRSGCNRLSDGDGDDPGRVAENVSARFALKCSTLQDDERRLRARYADRPDVIDALDQDGGLEIGDD